MWDEEGELIRERDSEMAPGNVGLLVMEPSFVFAKREEELRCGREKSSRGRGDCFVRDKFRFRFFFFVFFLSKLPLLIVLWRPVFIGKNIAKFSNLVPQFFYFLFL